MTSSRDYLPSGIPSRKGGSICGSRPPSHIAATGFGSGGPGESQLQERRAAGRTSQGRNKRATQIEYQGCLIGSQSSARLCRVMQMRVIVFNRAYERTPVVVSRVQETMSCREYFQKRHSSRRRRKMRLRYANGSCLPLLGGGAITSACIRSCQPACRTACKSTSVTHKRVPSAALLRYTAIELT
jgi:hypothetical protein